MSSETDWLPPLFLLSDAGGDWSSYLEMIYRCFRHDFIECPPTTIKGKRFALKRHPMELGKEATFWHLISKGKSEADRTPDFRRCERICWPRPMIEALSGSSVLCWANQRNGEDRILIALSDFSYLVVLVDRKEYVLLWTAYYVEYEHAREKLKKEYEDQSRSPKMLKPLP